MNVPLDITLQDCSTGQQAPSAARVNQWASAAYHAAELPAAAEDPELTIRIVDEEEMRQLNQTYRQKTGATNVLSFPFEAPAHIPLNLLGDIVICASVVKQEAHAQNKSLDSHWAHMVVHGVLHLLGYDHITDDEADTMESLEINVLESVGFSNPYLTFTLR
jgi:probable rRNA maturation factor